MAIRPHYLLKRRGRLPHWREGGSTYFLTFRARRVVSEVARGIVLQNLAELHPEKWFLHVGLMMPDHCHAVVTPQPLTAGEFQGEYWDLSKLVGRVKGASSRAINSLEGFSGALWQKESYDRIPRDEEEFLAEMEYIWLNPVRAGLVALPEDYPYRIRNLA